MIPEYPKVLCHKHDAIESGYIVCDHCYSGESVTIHTSPAESELGEIICKLGSNHTAEDLFLMCKRCALEHFKGKLPQ